MGASASKIVIESTDPTDSTEGTTQTSVSSKDGDSSHSDNTSPKGGKGTRDLTLADENFRQDRQHSVEISSTGDKTVNQSREPSGNLVGRHIPSISSNNGSGDTTIVSSALTKSTWSQDVFSNDFHPTNVKRKQLPKIAKYSTAKMRKDSFDSDNELLNELTQKTDFITESKTQEYPESYAMKMTNKQYKRQQSDLLREKTIVRDPEEWAYTYEDKFASSFHQKPHHANEEMNGKNIDSHVPPTQSTARMQTENEKRHAKELIPKYDVSEEMLMSEIEKEFL